MVKGTLRAGILVLFMVVVLMTDDAGVVAADSGEDAAVVATAALHIYGGGLRPLVSQTEDGVQTLNVYGPGNRIVAQVALDADGSTQDVRYLLSDHVGSTRVVLDDQAETVAAFDYSPYGETSTHGDEADALEYRYTGQRVDDVLDSHHFPAREYEPELGRFVSVDPAREGPSPYLYAADNPVNLVDPTGGTVNHMFFVDREGFPKIGSSTHTIVPELLRLLGQPSELSHARTGVHDLKLLRADPQSKSAQTPVRMFLNKAKSTGIVYTDKAYIVLGPDSSNVPTADDVLAWIEYTRTQAKKEDIKGHESLMEHILVLDGSGREIGLGLAAEMALREHDTVWRTVDLSDYSTHRGGKVTLNSITVGAVGDEAAGMKLTPERFTALVAFPAPVQPQPAQPGPSGQESSPLPGPSGLNPRPSTPEGPASQYTAASWDEHYVYDSPLSSASEGSLSPPSPKRLRQQAGQSPSTRGSSPYEGSAAERMWVFSER